MIGPAKLGAALHGKPGDRGERSVAARDDAKKLRRVTQHWFRHMLATRMRHDIRAAMEQGGWREERSMLGYVHDGPESRRSLIGTFDDFATSLTRDKPTIAITLGAGPLHW